MTANAVGLAAVSSCHGMSAAEIFGPAHSLKVVWVYAQLLTAEMVDFLIGWYGSIKHAVKHAVRVIASSIDRHRPISAEANCTHVPQPAARIRLGHEPMTGLVLEVFRGQLIHGGIISHERI